MAQVREKGGRVIFIGNIPYGVSEEQICELFGRAGEVVSFRLVYDKETRKPKGYGFLEFTTPDAAATAVRNLNDHEIMGRHLRVDYSNDNDKGNKAGGDALSLPVPGQIGADPNGLPQLPAGVEIAPGLTAPDAISRTVTQIPPPQLLDILSQMKNLVAKDPARATALLQEAPQMGYALFQALLLLGLVSTDVLASLIATDQNHAPPPQQQQQPQPVHPLPPQAMPPQTYQQQMPPMGYPPMPQHYPPGYPQQNYATPPPAATTYAPPPAVQPPPGLTPEVIQMVAGLSRDQIMALDEGARAEIVKLRVALGMPPIP